MIRELGLNAFSFHAPFAEHIDITALNTHHRNVARDEIFKAADAAADAAAELGVQYLVIHPGPERNETKSQSLSVLSEWRTLQQR